MNKCHNYRKLKDLLEKMKDDFLLIEGDREIRHLLEGVFFCLASRVAMCSDHYWQYQSKSQLLKIEPVLNKWNIFIGKVDPFDGIPYTELIWKHDV